MSADNYYYVRKREDGKFGVSHRFASIYYADEGHTVESLQADYDSSEPGKYVVDESWIHPVPPDLAIEASLYSALRAADRLEADSWAEYGVTVQSGLDET